MQLGETVRDVRALHNENFVAVAQKKYAYIYDNQGAEVSRGGVVGWLTRRRHPDRGFSSPCELPGTRTPRDVSGVDSIGLRR